MKKIEPFIMIFFIMAFVLYFLYAFFCKHYIQYSACYKLPMQTCFWPYAYEFINTREKLQFHIEGEDKAFDVDGFIRSKKIDFDRHTYLIVHGAPVENMYYSWKTTLFDDISPDWAKAWRYYKQCVFINYRAPTGGVYIYEIKKDVRLRGFGGA